MSSNPGILSRVFNTLDANTTAFGVITHDQTVPLKVSDFLSPGTQAH